MVDVSIWEGEKIVTLPQRDFQLLFVGFIRYTIDRKSYITNTSVDYATMYAKYIDDWLLKNLIGEIETAIKLETITGETETINALRLIRVLQGSIELNT